MRLIIFLCLLVNLSYAANMMYDSELPYHMPDAADSILEQKVTINWKFNSFNDFIQALQKNYSINYKIMSNAANSTSAISLYLDNGSLRQLITQAGNKFGYKWKYKDNTVIFQALDPLIPYNLRLTSANLTWNLMPADKTLRNVLVRWCKIANWQLVWNVHADYPITTSWVIYGTFETAVNEVLKASEQTGVPLLAIMHDSNHVIEITSPVVNVK